MYNRGGNSNLPTLTDHFKQALSMTRSQLQAGPSPLTSASQMGVGSSPFVNPITNAPFATNVPLPATQDAVYGSPALPGDAAEYSGGGGISELLFSYGKWILLALLIAGAVGAYFWWKKRKIPSSDDLVEELTNNLNDLHPQRSIQRPIHRLNNQNTNPSALVNHPFGPSRFSANPPTSPLPPILNQPQTIPENLRDNEQRTSVRGAEFSNPSIMSQMVPMSTRLKPPEPTQSMPPTDLPRQPQLQQLPVQQQQFQQQPPVQQQQQSFQPPVQEQSIPSLPPISVPTPPISAPPTQLVAPSLPVSQPPISADVPISSTQGPQMVQSSSNQADPNFTAI